jgi:hypothetical protein
MLFVVGHRYSAPNDLGSREILAHVAPFVEDYFDSLTPHYQRGHNRGDRKVCQRDGNVPL